MRLITSPIDCIINAVNQEKPMIKNQWIVSKDISLIHSLYEKDKKMLDNNKNPGIIFPKKSRSINFVYILSIILLNNIEYCRQ